MAPITRGNRRRVVIENVQPEIECGRFAIKRAVGETERRRKIQLEYNKKNHITPKTIIREIRDILPTEEILNLETKILPKSKSVLEELLKQKEKEMKEAAKMLDFELAAILRDEIKILNTKVRGKTTGKSG